LNPPGKRARRRRKEEEKEEEESRQLLCERRSTWWVGIACVEEDHDQLSYPILCMVLMIL